MGSTESPISQGDSVDDENTQRTALFNRLAERHAQRKVEQHRRREQTSFVKDDDSIKSKEFLSKFLQTKSSVVADLDSMTQSEMHKTLNKYEVTKFLDEIHTRLESMQNWLNETSIYLTSFDMEQARAELKNLNSLFQDKRENLLPTRKFIFASKLKTKPNVNDSAVSSDKASTTALEKSSPAEKSHILVTDTVNYDPHYSFVDIEGPCRLVLPRPGESEPEQNLLHQSIYLADLVNCIVEVNQVCGNLTICHLSNCQVYVHPVAGSIWLDNCSNCDFMFACRQLRIHSSTSCRLAIHVCSRPIIESCTSLAVAPYQLNYKQLEADLLKAGIAKDVNLWSEVEDFSCPNKRLTTGSPNWSVLPETEWFKPIL